jgi:hypothetical protein
MVSLNPERSQDRQELKEKKKNLKQNSNIVYIDER